MLKLIDRFLNNITMYRLVLYYLIFLVAAAAGLSVFGMLPFSPFALLFSTAFITFLCWAANRIFTRTFRAQANVESLYITALILALIITPLKSFGDLPFLGWAAILAIASKFIFAIKKKHIFNPAAFAVALTALALGQSASWWVGSLNMLPFVTAGGFLIVRKIRRFDLFFSFFWVSLAAILGFSLLAGENLISTAVRALLDTPLLFFALVMLTEPLTTPPTKRLRKWYGGLVGFLFAPQLHIGSIYSTPELALLAGNIFSYIVSPKEKLILKLKEKIQLAPDVFDFLFTPDRKLAFQPGQYLEWTLGHQNPDSRGNRRYFTIASSPTEEGLRMGVKFYQNSSSFKKTLGAMNKDSEIVASQLAGDFVLPPNLNQKLVFIAGGIGITPFRSMIKYMLDRRERRPIILFYSNKTAADIVYKDIFFKALNELGIKTVYTLTDPGNIPPTWQGRKGFIDEKMIKEEIPDYRERMFYLSGPHSMVTAFEETLKKMGVAGSQIKTDFFPGFA